MMKSEEMINKTLEMKDPQYRYFITSVTNINTFVSVKRRHWNIESFHCILDNPSKED